MATRTTKREKLPTASLRGGGGGASKKNTTGALVVGLATFVGTTLSRAESPDFLADVLRGDGVGHVDVGYCYKNGKTSRVTCNLRIERRGMGDRAIPAETGVSRGLFGFLHNSSGSISYVRYYGNGSPESDKLQCWGRSYDLADTQSLNSKEDISLAIDYDAGKIAWDGETFSTDIAAPTADSPISYWVFGVNGNSTEGTPFDLKSLTIREKAADQPVAVRDMKPCFANGKAALYDVAGEKVHYPTSDGFTLSGYDIALDTGRSLVVNAASHAPRTLAFAGDNALAFDGLATLRAESTVTLPTSGKVTVSLLSATGKGRYVLIDNLPPDYDLDATFSLGSLPAGTRGALSKDGSALVLTLSAEGLFPEAIADVLKGDGVGHVDTGYFYAHDDDVKTTRLVADFQSDDRGMGLAEVGVPKTRSVFGFLNDSGESAGTLSYLRFTGTGTDESDQIQLWGEGFDYRSDHVDTLPGRMKGALSFVVDYTNETGSFFGGASAFPLKRPARTSPKSVWLLSANGHDHPAALDFVRMSVHEERGGVDCLAHEFVPAVHAGRPGVYDRVSREFMAATSEGFSARGLRFRLAVNGEVIHVAGPVTVAASRPDEADGYLVTADGDGRIVAKGDGSTASFDMPEEPASAFWVTDGDVAPGATLEVASALHYRALAVGAGATLAFAEGGTLSFASLALPSEGKVKVTFEGANLPGERVLATGVSEDLSLSALELAAVPEGCTGSLARIGSRLVLTLARDRSAALVASALKGDGVGYVNTGYCYTYSDAVKTSRIVADFESANRGMGTNQIGVASRTRAVFGYLDASARSLSYVRFAGNGEDARDKLQLWGDDYASLVKPVSEIAGKMLGAISFVIDYAQGTASYLGGAEPFGLASPKATSSKSIWILNVNGNSSPASLDFRKMEIYERRDGVETLAHRFVPALTGDDKAAVYDTVAKKAVLPTAGVLAVDFGRVEQTFFAVRTVSEGLPVSASEFGVGDTLCFLADGQVTARRPLASLTLTWCDAEGAVVSKEEKAGVSAGDAFPVKLSGAAKVMATALPACPAEKTVAQAFPPVDCAGVAPAAFRRVKRHGYELAVSGAATLTFRSEVAEVWADDYAADGICVGRVRLSGPAAPGASLEVPASAAAWRLVRVAEVRPGCVLLVR